MSPSVLKIYIIIIDQFESPSYPLGFTVYLYYIIVSCIATLLGELCVIIISFLTDGRLLNVQRKIYQYMK